MFESPGIGQSHRWTYRGQIVPANRRVTVQAEIKACDDRTRLLAADGHLEVDGKVIYQMNDFSIRLGRRLAAVRCQRHSFFLVKTLGSRWLHEVLKSLY